MIRIALVAVGVALAFLPLLALAQSGAALVTAETRDFKVMFNEKSAWTLYEIHYRGTMMAGHNGFYGAVITLPGKSFVGTGHTEGGQEQVEKVELLVDGRKRPLEDKASYKGHRVLLKKTSMIDKLKHSATIEVTDDRIREHHEFTAAEDEAVNLMYAFMHPWVPTTKYWIARPLEGELLRGEFVSDKAMKMKADVRWIALYDPTTKKGMVAAYPKPVAGKGLKNSYWDQPHYHKLYFQTLASETIKAGTSFEYEIVLAGFESPLEGWEKKAISTAEKAVK
jgi:hypothetical protein